MCFTGQPVRKNFPRGPVGANTWGPALSRGEPTDLQTYGWTCGPVDLWIYGFVKFWTRRPMGCEPDLWDVTYGICRGT